MTSVLAQGSLQQSLEDLLPAHMMSLAIEELYQKGFEIRLDTRGYLENSVKAVLRRHTGQELVLAKKVDAAATAIMRHTDLDDAQTALLAVSFMLCKLVEEQLYLDVTSQAVLSAMMICADSVEDENPETAKIVKVAQEKAGRMLAECLNQGYYKHVVVPN